MEKFRKLFIGDITIYNKGAIDLYRMVFALGGIVFSLNTLDQFYLLFNFVSKTEVVLYQGLIFAWIACSFILFFFVPSRWFLFINYLIVVILFSDHHGVFNVEGKFMIFGTFFNMFLPLGKRSSLDKHDYSIITLQLIVMSAYLFFGGFITKAIDPNWASGVGLYYVMILPWIKYSFLNILLHSPLTLKVMNYFVLFVELFGFVFSIFSATRKFGILLVWCFCLFLFLLLQIFTIGFSAFAFGILFLAIFPYRITYLQNRLGLDLNSLLIRFSFLNPILKLNEKINCFVVGLRGLIVSGLFAFLLIVIVRDTDNAFFHNRYGRYWGYVDKLNLNSYCLFYDHLFTAMHFADVVEYRIKIKLKDGQIIEPVQVFNEDKTGGSYSGMPYNARWLQAEMYRFNEPMICPFIEENHVLPWHVQKLFRYLESKVNYQSIESFHFYTAQLKMPAAFDPNGSTYAAGSPWKEILIYNPNDKTAILPNKNTKIHLVY